MADGAAESTKELTEEGAKVTTVAEGTDATAAPSGASSSHRSTADRRSLAKKRGCNPKKNTSCCRTPRRTPPRAAPPPTHRGR